LQLERYHAARSLGHQPFRSACYAPFVGLSFDVHGSVSVCAFTRTTPLGRIGERPLLEMWDGAGAADLRAAVRADDLDHRCSRCAEEIAGGNLRGVLAQGFDRFVADADRPWPSRMEFALTNACNLQCVMCSGEFSSAIRAHREGLPPLASPYDEAFLEELTPFLGPLEQARFLGGEPFLADINYRIWDLMTATGSTAECNVTTNGTQWGRRVEAVLEQLPFSVGISMDGVRRRTIESIRAGVSYDRLMANLDRFLAYRDRRGLSLSLTFCLMVDNWEELGAFLRFADERDCGVYVNTVRQPPRHSLFHLPSAELRLVVDRLERESAVLRPRLTLNAHVWDEQLDRLRSHLDRIEQDGDRHLAQHGRCAALVDELASVGQTEQDVLNRLAAEVADGRVSVLRMDDGERLTDGLDYLGIDVSPLLGAPASAVLALVADRYGHRAEVLAERVRPGVVARVVSFDDAGRSPTVVASITRKGPPPHATTRLAGVLAPQAALGGVPVGIGRHPRR
jgi:MoaA/NifB/PqqE/SkfB family radical SAM enzyme